MKTKGEPMKKLIGTLCFLFLSGQAVASTTGVICVRNYLNAGTNTCEMFPREFAYLVNVDPDAMFETCARKRPASFCEMSEDFVWVISKQKEKVCTQRFDTDVADLCQTNPKNYAYVYVGG